MKEENKWPGILLNIGIPIVTVVIIIVLGLKLLGFFMPFLIGWLIALIANPPVRFLERHVKIRRKAGSVLLIAGVLALIVLGGFFILRALFWEVLKFAKQLPEMFQNMGAEIQGMLQADTPLLRLLPESAREALLETSGKLNEVIAGMAASLSQPAIGAAGTVAKNIPAALVYFLVTVMSAYFFIVDHDKLKQMVETHLPESAKKYRDAIKQKLSWIVGGYFAAQFKIMFVVAVILLIGFMILGVSYSVPLAILVAFLDMLPVFGTGTVLIPWAVIALIGGRVPFAIGLLALYAVTQVVRQLIQPKIVGDSMGMNPLLTLFLLYVGFRVRGLGGMILAVPVGLIVIEIYRAGVFDSFFRDAGI